MKRLVTILMEFYCHLYRIHQENMTIDIYLHNLIIIHERQLCWKIIEPLKWVFQHHLVAELVAIVIRFKFNVPT